MNLGKMMKDLQKMQAKMQEDLDGLEIEATAGGGVVTARMNGKKQLLSLKLAPEAIMTVSQAKPKKPTHGSRPSSSGGAARPVKI